MQTPTLDPTDRPAPHGAGSPAPPAGRRPLLMGAAGALALAVAGTGGWLALRQPDPAGTASQRPVIRVGSLDHLPDIRDGVPGLKPRDVPTTTGSVQPGELPVNARAPVSAVASSGLRPALAGQAASPPADPLVPRRVETSRPTETAAVPTSPAPVLSPEPSRPVRTGELAASRTASLPSEAPLPPARPGAPAPAAEKAAPAEKTARPRPEPTAAAAKPTPPERSAALAPARPSPPPTARRAEPREEERTVLGVPIPGFVPTGRDIREAASTVANAVTSLPDRF